MYNTIRQKATFSNPAKEQLHASGVLGVGRLFLFVGGVFELDHQFRASFLGWLRETSKKRTMTANPPPNQLSC